MKTILTFIFCSSLLAFGQTKLIAFKSHSGNMTHFSNTGFDNLGLPPDRIYKIELINDSTIIESTRYSGIDTVVNHPICKIPHLTVDTLKGLYYRKDIEFVGFDTVLTKKEIKRQKKWAKNQVRLKKKRTKLLNKYKEVDKKIVDDFNPASLVLLGGGNNDDNFTNEKPVVDYEYFTYFSIALFGFVIIMFTVIYNQNKKKVIA